MAPDVSALLLAAGESVRMGRAKQLLSVGGRPAVVRCLESILEAGVDDVTVVIRPGAKDVAEALRGFPVRLAVNDRLGSDMAASVRAGLGATDARATGILVCLSDYPLVKPFTLAAMKQEHLAGPGAIVIPTHQGRKGHPTLFPRSALAEIATLPTLRDIIRRHRDLIVHLEVDDEGILLDMDTPEDYRRILQRTGGTSAREDGPW